MLRSILLGSVTGVGCALVCACLVRMVLRCMKRAPLLKGPVVFSPQVSPKSLHSALTAETPPLVPIGGNYYKTSLLMDVDNHGGGFAIAVKKLQPQPRRSRRRRRMIQRELEVLAGLRHRHLMILRAYYYVVGDDSFCLVYDYLPTGSLEDAMRRLRINQIGWDARLRIAVGIIKGLQYLHFTCNPPIFHYNLKPSNVLLDADFEPRLGDYGHTFYHHTRPPSQHYAPAPPECSSSSIYTEKSDIFSFGVILGMLLTGRDPSDPLFAQLTNGSGSGSGSGSSRRGGMGMWFRQLVEAGDVREALDKRLLGEETEEDEMLMAVRIAAVCLSDMPSDRPSSDELVPMLTQLHSF